MTTRLYPTDVFEQAQSVYNAWSQINEDLPIGDLNLAVLAAEINKVVPLKIQKSDLEIQLTDIRNKQEALNMSLWDKVKRVRASMKGIYGDDSSQYEMVGGTRMSERKSATRKPKTGA
jgi:hypothetical protein